MVKENVALLYSQTTRYIIRGLLKHGSDVLNQSGTRSLEQPIAENEAGEQLLVEDTVQDVRAVKAFEEIERLDEYKALYEAVDSLPDEQREIIIEHYFKGLTYQQIGELHGFTLDRVRHRHSRALISLGSGEIGTRLREIYGADYGMYDYARHKGLKAFRSSGTSEIEDYVLRRLRNR